MPAKPLNKYLNINIANYLNESRGMTAAARGVYVDLMIHACQNGGIVPKDEIKLRKIARIDPRVWKQIRDDVLAAMEPVADGFRIHHSATSVERYEQTVAAASSGGRAKAATAETACCRQRAAGQLLC